MRKKYKEKLLYKDSPHLSKEARGYTPSCYGLQQVIKYSPDSNEKALDIRHESYRAAWLGCNNINDNFNLNANDHLNNTNAARGIAPAGLFL